MKYEMFGKVVDGLQRIIAIKYFGNVKAGDIGGWIFSEANLSQKGNCWVYDDAIVKGKAIVTDNAAVKGDAIVKGKAIVTDNAAVKGYVIVKGRAIVGGDAIVEGYAIVGGDAIVEGYAIVKGKAIVKGDAIVGGAAIVKGDAIVKGYATVRGKAIVRKMRKKDMRKIVIRLRELLDEIYEEAHWTGDLTDEMRKRIARTIKETSNEYFKD